MNTEELSACLTFIREAERLKNVHRSAYTSTGKQESTAEHTWRLCLLGMVFESDFSGIDFGKLLKICVVHDLGAAISGDIPAVEQVNVPNKSALERADLVSLLSHLPDPIHAQFLALWDEYENAASPEARLVKGLDKIETIIQHNQGKNPPDFDYSFNLTYGQKQMGAHPLFEQIRAMIDADTAQRHRESSSGGARDA